VASIPTKKQLELDISCLSLIGKNIKITESKNPNQIGFEGLIIDETVAFFIIENNGVTRRILKKNIKFDVEAFGKALNIDGRLLFSTIQARIKKIK
jgi:RNase P/RNase MRP subunit p29